MNAPSGMFAIPEAVSDLERGYRASVSIHFPNADPFTMACRVELMALRDKSASALRVCSDESAPILSEASRLATIYALSARPAKTLYCVQAACCSMFEAARMIERGCRSKRGGDHAE